ncbi:hypothetical protein [Acidiphilium multivorum]|uniref:hypothetical protein n=1 Tax=Acidiphilium multivorum TaxID=62140 RepID=UPI001B8CD7A7|nr:hypothetical protein [Acidiphilium multivorum]MBS3024655.1 hypothetical protein [Acidiphilium multivorum]MBU6358169.1 hypothetical protein [Rhodospirillales bacterium]
MTHKFSTIAFRRPARAALGLALGLGLAAVPHAARAWGHPWWGPRFAIGIAVPAPLYPPPVYVAPPPRVWVPGHYNWRGRWIPGHWRWR